MLAIKRRRIQVPRDLLGLFRSFDVSFFLFSIQKLLVRSALGDEFQETTSGVVVFLVFLQMVGEFVDTLGQETDLNIRRARVLFVDAGFLNQSCFLLSSKHEDTLAQNGYFCNPAHLWGHCG